MPQGAALQLRRRRDGSVHVVGGELPDRFEFNARHIGREMEHPYGSMFGVFLTLNTEQDTAVYRLVGFGELDPDNPNDDRLNYGTWIVERLPASDPLVKRIAKDAGERAAQGRAWAKTETEGTNG